MSLATIRAEFTKAFGIPFELLKLPPEAELFPVNGSEFLLGTSECLNDPPLVHGQVLSFAGQDRTGLSMVGFWGHGFNSYAFYYALDDGRNKICLRLPYGGIYLDSARCAEEIADYLPAFVAYVEALPPGAAFVALESMGTGYYELQLKDVARRTHEESLVSRPRFEEALGLNRGRD